MALYYILNTICVYCSECPMVIAHPGQNVELLCSVSPSGGQTVARAILHASITRRMMAFALC